jgi:hypothetical protein
LLTTLKVLEQREPVIPSTSLRASGRACGSKQ